MGRSSRLHKERVIAGLEPPHRTTNPVGPNPVKMVRCRKCNAVMPVYTARTHIKECWPMNIGDNDPIPEEVPEQYLGGKKQYNPDGTLPV